MAKWSACICGCVVNQEQAQCYAKEDEETFVNDAGAVRCQTPLAIKQSVLSVGGGKTA